MKFLKTIIFLGLLLSMPSLAQVEAPKGQWEELPRPGSSKGLLMEPRLLGVGPRVHLVWSGTTDEITRPEFFHSSLSGDEKEWSSPRAPLFGRNKSRIRKLGIGKSRNLIGVILQRSLKQSNDAYEIILCLSSDRGWSWTKPVEIDSYVSEKAGGTWVAAEGREGTNRPEFALAWSREYGNVRAANVNISSSIRPEGVLVGQHVDGAVKADVGALGREGFSVIFNNGVGLATAHVKALTGKIEKAHTFIQGRFGNFFTMASRPFGPSRIAVGNGSTLETLTSDNEAWKKDEDESRELPFASSGVMAESDMDEQQDMHLALLVPTGANQELWYIGQRDHKWGTPEKIASYDGDVEIRGFDIAVTDDYIFTAISEGYKARFFRRKL